MKISGFVKGTVFGVGVMALLIIGLTYVAIEDASDIDFDIDNLGIIVNIESDRPLDKEAFDNINSGALVDKLAVFNPSLGESLRSAIDSGIPVKIHVVDESSNRSMSYTFLVEGDVVVSTFSDFKTSVPQEFKFLEDLKSQ